ncbi:hypothetical protein [Actinoplanes sp. NPDC049265]|uniref:hypothetical protein n=1 Tax=Actinoplanes sp. NPDC049265 TaxID=3363902 RepID=UPI00371B4D4D
MIPFPRIEHLWIRPSWDCRTCQQPWPCPTAREAMLDEFQQFPSVLIVYMHSQMTAAFLDMTASGQSPPADLFERFLYWATPRTSN